MPVIVKVGEKSYEFSSETDVKAANDMAVALALDESAKAKNAVTAEKDAVVSELNTLQATHAATVKTLETAQADVTRLSSAEHIETAVQALNAYRADEAVVLGAVDAADKGAFDEALKDKVAAAARKSAIVAVALNAVVEGDAAVNAAWLAILAGAKKRAGAGKLPEPAKATNADKGTQGAKPWYMTRKA